LNRWMNQIPSFINELNAEHKFRYKDIIRRIGELNIPVTIEDTGIYKNIITDFGTLAGNIIESVISPHKHIGLTISNICDNQEINQLIKRLPNNTYNKVKEYVDKQVLERKNGRGFNKIRHNDAHVVFIDFFSFIKETQQVIAVFIENKGKYV